MTLTSALDPLSFYPSAGQCADMVSAPHIFGSFYYKGYIGLQFYLSLTSTCVHVSLCLAIWVYKGR